MRLLNLCTKRSASRAPVRPFKPSPVPGGGSPNGSAGVGRLPSLPACTVGAPPGRPPGVTRPAPQLGGIRGVGIPPEMRRRIPGASRAAAGAADVSKQVHLALRKAQEKLLNGQEKLQTTTRTLRGKLAEPIRR